MGTNAQIEFAPFRLDPADERLWRGAKPVPLTPKAFAVLRYLAERPGRLVTKQELLEAVWADSLVTDASLHVCVREVREALGDRSRVPRFIETVHRRGYRFIAPAGRAGPAEQPGSPAHPRAGLPTPPAAVSLLVGREAELAELDGLLRRALAGERQVAFVTGEPGIGKTTLVDAFLTRSAGGTPVWGARGQCLEHYGQGEAYLPLLEAFGQLGRDPAAADRVRAVFARHAPTWLAEMPGLATPAGPAPPQPGPTRERMLRELAEAVEALSADAPLTLVLEDLHWSDYSTVDLIAALAQRRGPARLLLIGTYRPADLADRQHPLRPVRQQLAARRQCRELLLGLLAEPDVAGYLAARFPGAAFAADLARAIHRRTDGNPLFTVAAVDHLVDSGRVAERDGRWELTAARAGIEVEVPESVRGLIERQADRLGPEEQQVLEAGCVAGVEFSAAGVAAALGRDLAAVEECCEGLVTRHQFVKRGEVQELPDGTVVARYRFTHALYHGVLDGRTPPARRARLHRRIGEWMEAAYARRTADVAAELARHFEHGRDAARAVRYRQEAAQRAARLSAHAEAADHARRGLELLARLDPGPDRDALELGLQMLLGLQLQVGLGFAAPGVEAAYARSRDLCGRSPSEPRLVPVLWGLWMYSAVRAANRVALELADQLRRLGEETGDRTARLCAHNALGVTRLFMGEPAAARADLETAAGLYDPGQHGGLAWQFGQDFRVTALAQVANALWLAGESARAADASREAVALARRLAHPHSLALALHFAGILHQRRRDAAAVLRCAEELIRLSDDHGFGLWSAGGTVLRGSSVVAGGAPADGAAEIERGLAAWRATGPVVNLTYQLALLAEARGAAGRFEEGLAALAEAEALASETGEEYYVAELARLSGELRAASAGRRSRRSGAADCFRRALTVARKQEARALELRAALSWARLAGGRGAGDEAIRELAAVCRGFAPSADNPELGEARELLAGHARGLGR